MIIIIGTLASRCSTRVRKRALFVKPNLPTNIVGFGGFDSSIMLFLRDGIPRPIEDFTESLIQAILVGCNVSREIGRKRELQCMNPRLHSPENSRRFPETFGDFCKNKAIFL